MFRRCFATSPSKIKAKFVFKTPEITYSFVTDEFRKRSCIQLSPDVDWPISENFIKQSEAFFATTSRGNDIACLFFKHTDNPLYTILYSHGKYVDIGGISFYLYFIGILYNCNVLVYDYSGYGLSHGKASEKNLYADADCAWDTLVNKLGVNKFDIILYGQTLGTLPTVYLASHNEARGVILQSPITSGLNYAFPNYTCLRFNYFSHKKHIEKTNIPLLIVHGKKDSITRVKNGEKLYKRCKSAVDPLWIPSAGHYDIELYEEYFERVKRFLTVELGKDWRAQEYLGVNEEQTISSHNSKN